MRPLTFEVGQGDRLWLCGKNGSGKSSLLKLIRGEDIPFTGEVRRGSNLKISYVPQDASFLSGELSGYARLCEIDESLFKAILRKLGFLPGNSLKRIGSVQRGPEKKVLLAKSLCEQAHLYIWDEPLNYIDIFSRMQLEHLLSASALTLIFVEHDQTFSSQTATKIIRL